MQSSPPLLFSKLFPLPLTQAGFGQQNLSVFDVDEACFETRRGSATAAFAPCSIYPLDARNSTSREDCIVSVVPTPETDKPFSVHYVRTSTSAPKWFPSQLTRSTAFAPGTVGPVRGCDAAHLLELLTEQQQQSDEQSSHTKSKRQHACNIVRQWLSPDGRKVAMHVDCNPSQEWLTKQQQENRKSRSSSSSSSAPLLSFLLIFDSFAVPDTAGCCGWYLLAVIKLPRGESIASPLTSPESSSIDDLDPDRKKFPDDVSPSSSPQQQQQQPSTATFFNSELGSIVGGFVSNGVFLLGWNEHSLNVQLCTDKAGAILRLYKYKDDGDNSNKSQGKSSSGAEQQQRPPASFPIPSWLITSSSSISDEDAASLHFMHIHRVRYAVLPFSASAAMLQRWSSLAASPGASSGTAAQLPPPMLIQFRVRYTAPMAALLRSPQRHIAVADSALTNPSSVAASQSSGKTPVSSRDDLLAPTMVVSLATEAQSSAGGFGAALLRGAAALLAGSNNTSGAAPASPLTSPSATTAAAHAAAGPAGTTLTTLHKRIERVFSSSCCLVADAIMASQHQQQNENNAEDGSMNPTSSQPISVTPGSNSNYSLVWERTAQDSHKLHLFAGAKKAFFVSRENVSGSASPPSSPGLPTAANTAIAGSVLPTPGAPDSGGPVEGGGGGAGGDGSPNSSHMIPAYEAGGGGGGTSATATSTDCVVDLFRAGAHSVVSVGLMDEQRVRIAYVSDWKLNVIEVHFSVNSFFARKEQAPQLLYSVQLPQSFLNGGRAVDINNSTCASVGILSNGATGVIVQMPEKML